MSPHPLITAINNTTTTHGQCALWWLGQQGFVFKFGSTVVVIDPYLSPNAARLVPPPCPPEAFTNVDLVLGTHDHIDHIDRQVWPALAAAAPQATFVVPAPVRESLLAEATVVPQRLRGAQFGHEIKLNDVTIFPIPAAHELLDRHPESGFYPYLGYIISAHGLRIYHAGDTCIYEGLRPLLRSLPCDILILPINGRDAARLGRGCIGNMTWQEAADLAGSLPCRAVIPAHYEMFAGNAAPVDDFAAYVRLKYPRLDLLLPQHAQTLKYPTS